MKPTDSVLRPATNPVASPPQKPAVDPSSKENRVAGTSQPVVARDLFSRPSGGAGAPRLLDGAARGFTPVPARESAQGLLGIFDGDGGKDRQKLIASTKDLRDTTNQARALADQLAKLPPSDPRHADVKAKLAATEAKLSSNYGYTLATAPKPGTLWIDPQYLGKEVQGGKVTASKFPVGTPVTTPPKPMDVLFGRGQPLELLDADGKSFTVKSPEEYRAIVAQNRAAAGMPVQGGEPMAVHVSFEGGGGKGKRYGSTIAEMVSQGVVPASVSGNSAGSIAAAMVAAGANPAELDRIVKDPALTKFKDWDLQDGGGAFNGKASFEYFDQKLREFTGIKDRPVTFADLKIPLQLIAAKMGDSAGGDMSTRESRIFVFSQETTPNTPVALAIQASIAIPAVFDPVQMVDPMTGREVQLVDGGVMDSLPMGYNKNNLPQIGLSLYEKASNHPAAKDNTHKPERLPSGNVDCDDIIHNALNGNSLHKKSGAAWDDFRDRTDPKPGQFMLSVPTWNLKNPRQENSTLGFGYDPKVDPILDVQSRQVTRQFLKQFMGDFGNPQAKGTNVTTQVPQNLQFTTDLEYNGKTYKATYSGGDKVHFVGPDGKKFDLSPGKEKIEAIYLDHMSFGDLKYQLSHLIDKSQASFWEKLKDKFWPF